MAQTQAENMIKMEQINSVEKLTSYKTLQRVTGNEKEHLSC